MKYARMESEFRERLPLILTIVNIAVDREYCCLLKALLLQRYHNEDSTRNAKLLKTPRNIPPISAIPNDTAHRFGALREAYL